MKYEIKYYGDPVLRATSRPIEKVDESHREMARNMLETMAAARGIGLAAQQVGRTEALYVISIPPEMDVDEHGQRLHPDIAMPLIVINPEIVESSEERETGEEGCLSFPDITGPITRPARVTLRYQDEQGRPREIKASGLLGRAIQHEFDHLNGVLFIDHMSQIKRIALAGRLKRLKKETRRNVSD